MNCKSVSVMIGSSSSLLQPIIVNLAVLSPHYRSYYFDARVFVYIFFNFCIFFVFWVPSGILTHYFNIDSCIGLENAFNNGSYIRFSEKSLCFKWLRQFLLALFLLTFGFCLYLLLFLQTFLFSWIRLRFSWLRLSVIVILNSNFTF